MRPRVVVAVAVVTDGRDVTDQGFGVMGFFVLKMNANAIMHATSTRTHKPAAAAPLAGEKESGHRWSPCFLLVFMVNGGRMAANTIQQAKNTAMTTRT